jgi:hypothetical protein
MVTSYRTKSPGHRFLKPWGRYRLSVTESPWACLATGPSLTPGRGGRRDDQTGCEILPAHTHRMVEKV